MKLSKLSKPLLIAGKINLSYAAKGRPICEGCAYETHARAVVFAFIGSSCARCGYEVH